MPEQFIGFVAGTPLQTPDGFKAIEDIKPGDTIQVQPDDDQGDGKVGDEPGWWENN
jgi:hypothetical protein